jgi:putative hydrolase of the HAD superfamily
MSFANIRTWVFDLDNTLYPARALYDEIGERMTAYIARATGLDPQSALSVRERYFHEYGATVVGLAKHHDIDPRDFLLNVHLADHSVLAADAELRALIERLPGRRIVFTNGGGGHPQRVLESLQLDGLFETVFDIEDAELTPKPQRECYRRLMESCVFEARDALLIEDTLRNLEPAHELGFATALVGPVHPEPRPAYVDHWAPDVKTLLRLALGEETR